MIFFQYPVPFTSLFCFTGIGVNVKNKKPTICLNSVIDEHNKQKNTHLEHFCIEELAAATLSNIEKIMAEFEEYRVEEFCKIYCNYWLHRYGVYVQQTLYIKLDFLILCPTHFRLLSRIYF